MKQLIAAAVLLFLSMQMSGQGVNQLWGLSRGDHPNVRSHLFSWDSATNTIVNRKTFFASVMGELYATFSEHNGLIYGITGNNIFEWDPQTPEVPGTLRGSVQGTPNGNLVSWNGKMYGLTNTGGSTDSGFLFEWDPASLNAIEKTAFDFTKGSKPLGGLVLLNDKFYGMTAKGGEYDLGVIFEWDPSTNDFIKKLDFNGTNGASPNGNLAWNGSVFYGVTDSGGINNAGVLFSWDPLSNTYNKKFDFVAADGKNPCGTLVATGNRLYGMTTNGGTNGIGTIFLWNMESEIFSKRVDLNSTEGGNPRGSVTLYNNKLYANTELGMLEHDTSTNIYTKKYDGIGNTISNHSLLINDKLYNAFYYGEWGEIIAFDMIAGDFKRYITHDAYYFGGNPGAPGGLGIYQGKIYGLTDDGGAQRWGMVFRYDPSDYTEPYQPRYFFNRPEDGAYPSGNVFSGVTSWGGWYDAGTGFSYNLFENKISVSVHFDPGGDPSPGGKVTPWGMWVDGKLIQDMGTGDWVEHFNLGRGTGEPDLFEFNNKVYGVTDVGGGASNMGYFFEWDPNEDALEPRFVHKLDFNGANGASPTGTFTLLNGKFYGITRLGGTYNLGTLYEWDPLTDILTTLSHFDGTDKVTSPFTVMNGKLYGMRGGGANNKGTIFEFDPATAQLTTKGVFDGITNGKNSGDRFLILPAGIARSTPGSCVGFPAVTIDATNNNKWVPIVDSHGDVLAEIKANGNNLGLLTIQSYVNAGPVRQDGEGHLYLDRNITITPAQQPAEGNPVDIRLYIPQSEFDALLNTGNAAIEDIDDVAIFKGNENCDNNVHNATPLSTTAESYVHGYVLKASIPSFSSFYFASNVFAVLPLQLLSFSGEIKNNDAQLTWTTVNEQNTAGFEIERSTTNNSFVRVGMVASNNTTGNHNYEFIDAGIDRITDSKIYYRIKLKDKNGKFTYSPTIVLQLNTTGTAVQFYPNPVNGRANLVITSNKSQLVQWRILDNSGKTFGRNVVQVNKGAVALPVEAGALPKGVYYLDIKGSNFSKLIKFVKQ